MIILDINLSMCRKYIAGITLQLYRQLTVHKPNQKHIHRKISLALSGLSSLYYDDNGYGYENEDGNDRKDDYSEIKKTQNMHLSHSVRSFSKLR